MEILLERNNVVKKADTEEKAEDLIRQGFKIVGNPADRDLPAAKNSKTKAAQ